jgi:hypothetical protein
MDEKLRSSEKASDDLSDASIRLAGGDAMKLSDIGYPSSEEWIRTVVPPGYYEELMREERDALKEPVRRSQILFP